MRVTIDLSELTRNIPQHMKDVAKTVDDVATKMAVDLHKGLVLNTPVDTGRARAGWTVDTSTPAKVVENNVEYIEALNNGHSMQAPAGFVEAEIDKVKRP